MPEEDGRLDQIMAGVLDGLRDKYAARERALPLCRELIRTAANSIRAVHRDEFDQAGEMLARGEEILREIRAALAGHADIYHAGFVHDAAKEYAEARITLALVSGGKLPSPADLEVEGAAWLNGLAEAGGELRRYLLDQLRRGNVDRCEPFLALMDDIYTALVTVDFPDAMTGGLRRNTDMVRGVLEKTRGDLTVAVRQQDLEARMRGLEDRLGD
jgi:translin